MVAEQLGLHVDGFVCLCHSLHMVGWSYRYNGVMRKGQRLWCCHFFTLVADSLDEDDPILA